MPTLLEFTAAGSPVPLSRAIEDYAREQGQVSAIVVPWESDGGALSMAVTSVKTDGWAIEHTNLGTIRVTGLPGDRSRVVVDAADPEHPEKARLARVLAGFAEGLQARLSASS